MRITTRQALNRLRTMKRRRQAYVGQWPPAPLLTTPDVADPSVQPVAASVYAVSVGPVGASLSVLVDLLGAVGGSPALARPTPGTGWAAPTSPCSWA